MRLSAWVQNPLSSRTVESRSTTTNQLRCTFRRRHKVSIDGFYDTATMKSCRGLDVQEMPGPKEVYKASPWTKPSVLSGKSYFWGTMWIYSFITTRDSSGIIVEEFSLLIEYEHSLASYAVCHHPLIIIWLWPRVLSMSVHSHFLYRSSRPPRCWRYSQRSRLPFLSWLRETF